jgi:transcription elongation factor Elf1
MNGLQQEPQRAPEIEATEITNDSASMPNDEVTTESFDSVRRPDYTYCIAACTKCGHEAQFEWPSVAQLPFVTDFFWYWRCFECSACNHTMLVGVNVEHLVCSTINCRLCPYCNRIGVEASKKYDEHFYLHGLTTWADNSVWLLEDDTACPAGEWPEKDCPPNRDHPLLNHKGEPIPRSDGLWTRTSICRCWRPLSEAFRTRGGITFV